MTFSLATLQLLDGLVKNTTLNGQADDFEEAAMTVLTARRELADAIEAHPDFVKPNREQRRAKS